jgi:hypothetical protein
MPKMRANITGISAMVLKTQKQMQYQKEQSDRDKKARKKALVDKIKGKTFHAIFVDEMTKVNHEQ